MTLDLLWPWRGPLLALVVALAWAGLLRALRRPDLAALGAGIGLAAGVVMTLGMVPGSPRQLPERLPLLALGGALLGLVLAVAGARRGVLAAGLVAIGLSAGAWWLVGAPMPGPDLRRGTLALASIAALLVGLALALRGPWQAAYAAAILAAGLWLSAPFGPWLVLAVIVLGAALGGVVAGPLWAAPARLPVALGLGALLAGPVIARGSALDWTIGAGPVLALLVVPLIEAEFPGRWARPIACIIAAILSLMFIMLQLHGT
jgi:hypothetical protein